MKYVSYSYLKNKPKKYKKKLDMYLETDYKKLYWREMWNVPLQYVTLYEDS